VQAGWSGCRVTVFLLFRYNLNLNLNSGQAVVRRIAPELPHAILLPSRKGGGLMGRINVLSGTPSINLYGLLLISSGARLAAARLHTSTHKLSLTLALIDVAFITS